MRLHVVVFRSKEEFHVSSDNMNVSSSHKTLESPRSVCASVYVCVCCTYHVTLH
jgi:hypothetical protein